jgi:hypothetical protein
MKQSNAFLLLLTKKKPISFYRNKLSFLIDLLTFCLKNKILFYVQRRSFLEEIKKKVNPHLEVTPPEESFFYTNIIKEIHTTSIKKNDYLYSFLVSYASIALYLAYFPIGILSYATNQQNFSLEIQRSLEYFEKQYPQAAKIIFININKTLIKGLSIAFKNTTFDVSQAKLTVVLEKQIVKIT